MKQYTVDTLLMTATPMEWVDHALKNLPLLLVDHGHCEKKAAATALGMIYRYSDKPVLLEKMSRLAREELRHFEQVLGVISGRGEQFYHLSPGSYATYLHKHVVAHEPKKLIDSLIIGAFIEARSCERFRLLAERLPSQLAAFYRKLYLAEARHFEIYLKLAQHFALGDIEERIKFFGNLEASFILKEDDLFRFHSGLPHHASNSNNSEPSLIKSPI